MLGTKMRCGFRFINPLQLSLALIKPDASHHPFVLKGIQDILLKNFYIVRTRYLRLSFEDASSFYENHKSKFFFNRLVTFMSSGQIYAHILAHENAIELWRTLMGPTKSFRAQYEMPNSIRGRFGLTDTRNAVHGSDSNSSALQEIKVFFPNFNTEKWYQEEEKHFRCGNVSFDADTFSHLISK